MAATYPWAARLFLLCVSLEVFATPTGRYHGRMLIHPSSPAAPPLQLGVCTYASSRPSRVRRRLLRTCLGDPIHLTIRPVKFSGVTLNLNSKLLTSSLSCNVVNPGKIFHSNTIGSPSILSKVLYCGERLNHVNLSSHEVFDCGFSFTFQGIIQNLKRRRPLCARD